MAEALSFLGIGAQKAGTTWLHALLRQHPDIGMPEQKELHFWDGEALGEPDIAAYLARFAALRGRARGEITPSYAILPPQRIALIRARLPELVFLYVLRDPIERAWSQAKMDLSRQYRKGLPAGFDTHAWFTAHFRSPASLARGDYARCLAHWFAHYPRERFLIGVHEEVRRAPRPFLQACARHLGVDEGFYTGLAEAQLNTLVYPEVEVLDIPRLDLPAKPPQDYRVELETLYAPRIAATEEILGRPLASLWRGA